MKKLLDLLKEIFLKEEVFHLNPAKKSKKFEQCYHKEIAEEKRRDKYSFLSHFDYDCINCSGSNKNCKRYEFRA